METEKQSVQPEPCCKVGRALRSYDLEDFGTELVHRWTDQNGESASLRELKRELNRELVRTALSNAGVSPIEGEAENLRRVLQSSEVSESRRIEVHRRLEDDGIEVEGLLDDFVSHQTIHNHLRDCQNATVPDGKSDDEQLSQAESTIFGLQSRTEVVTAKTLTQLGTNGIISPEEFNVVVDIQAICEDCGRSSDIGDLLNAGQCRCQD